MEVKAGGEQQDFMGAEVRSTILKSVGEAQVVVYAELHANLGEMVNNPDFSAVVYLSNDGKQVQALRMLLAYRSPVLKSMLMGDTAESNLTEISLPKISLEVLLCIFEYLYTGTLSDHHFSSWRLACEIISASRYFLLPSLEMITRKFLISPISSAAKDLSFAGSLLKL